MLLDVCVFLFGFHIAVCKLSSCDLVFLLCGHVVHDCGWSFRHICTMASWHGIAW